MQANVSAQPCKLIIKVIKAENLIKMDDQAADPFVELRIKGSPETPMKTRTMDHNLNPVWDNTIELLVNDWSTDILLVDLLDEDIRVDAPMMDQIEFPINKWPIGTHYDFQENIKLGDKDAGKLYLAIDVVEADPKQIAQLRDISLEPEQPVAEPEQEHPEAGPEQPTPEPAQPAPDPVQPAAEPEQPVPEPVQPAAEPAKVTVNDDSAKINNEFSLGNYSTTYSTDFSGYSDCTHSLSKMHSTDEKFHHEHLRNGSGRPRAHTRDIKLGDKPNKIAESIQGKIIKASGLPKTDHNGSDTYVVLTVIPLSGKGKNADKVKTEIQHNTQDPVWDKDFEFPFANTNDSLRCEIYQHHKILGDKLIACCEVVLKDLKDNQPIVQALPLIKPAKAPRVVKNVKDFGTITLSLTHNIQYE